MSRDILPGPWPERDRTAAELELDRALAGIEESRAGIAAAVERLEGPWLEALERNTETTIAAVKHAARAQAAGEAWMRRARENEARLRAWRVVGTVAALAALLGWIVAVAW
jgi:hypothetical protein